MVRRWISVYSQQNVTSVMSRSINDEISLQEKILDVIATLRFDVGFADQVELCGGGERLFKIFSAASTCSADIAR